MTSAQNTQPSSKLWPVSEYLSPQLYFLTHMTAKFAKEVEESATQMYNAALFPLLLACFSLVPAIAWLQPGRLVDIAHTLARILLVNRALLLTQAPAPMRWPQDRTTSAACACATCTAQLQL